MSPVSPVANESTLFRLAITADGAAIDDTLQVVSVDVWSAVNKIPRARIVLYDGSVAEADFPVSAGDTFTPGKAIEIKAGYEDASETIFSGLVVAHGIEITRANASTLVVDLADNAIKMTISRKSAIFEDKVDSDVISSLISSAGLSAEVEATTTSHPAVVQYDATDWDMMLLRAEMNGMVATTAAGKVTVKVPDTSQEAALKVTYGESLIDFRAEIDAVRQIPSSAIKSYAWDSDTQAALQSAPGSVSVTEAGNLSSDTLAQVCGVSAFNQLTGGFVVQDDLQAWSSAELLRSKLAKIRGRARFQGSALAVAGSMLQLDGVGARFNGSVFVSAVHHDIRQGRWLTNVEFGLGSEGFANTSSVGRASASGLIPPIKGLHVGVVLKVAEDPLGGYRVQVSFPLSEVSGVWARLSSFYASNAVGAVFYPEVGDEVVVGFMNEDPRFPIILGSLYGKKLVPGLVPEAKNNTKGLITRSKMEVTFNEEDKIITIKTPGTHTITLDDKTGEITLADSNKNSVKLGKDGITLDSPKNITLTAKGNIELTATGNVALKATGNATCEGLQVQLKAQTAFSAEGSATAELKSSGMLTVQGALVKIN